jgi:hypothetical protein
MSIHLSELNGSRQRVISTSILKKVIAAHHILHLFNDNVIENLQSIGISLGNSSDQIALSVERIKEI